MTLKKESFNVILSTSHLDIITILDKCKGEIVLSEKGLENKIKKHLKDNGHYYIKISASVNMRSGIPDIIACIFGRFVAIEVKNPNGKGKVSGLQRFHINEIETSGGNATVIDSFEDYLEFYNEVNYSCYMKNK